VNVKIALAGKRKKVGTGGDVVTIAKQFFTTRKDWYRNGVATLQKIGQDWGKRLEKGLNKRLTVRASRC